VEVPVSTFKELMIMVTDILQPKYSRTFIMEEMAEPPPSPITGPLILQMVARVPGALITILIVIYFIPEQQQMVILVLENITVAGPIVGKVPAPMVLEQVLEQAALVIILAAFPWMVVRVPLFLTALPTLGVSIPVGQAQARVAVEI
jgi:hypothetical protein